METGTHERCNEQVEDLKHLLWDYKHLERSRKKITEIFEINIELKHHDITMGVLQTDFENHETIHTIQMAI